MNRLTLVAPLALLAVAGVVMPVMADAGKPAQRPAKVEQPVVTSSPSALRTPRQRVEPKPDIQKGTLAPAFRLTVLHNNDGETALLPIATGPAAGAAGIGRFVTLVNQQKAAAIVDPGDGIPRGVVMVSSGDNSLPGANFNANDVRPTGTPLYDTRAFQLIGYDGITLGNHDFDNGPGPLGQIIAGLNVPPSGPFLSANLNFANEPLLAPFTTGPNPKLARSVVRNVNGRLVGIVGATTTDLPFISSPGPNIIIGLNVAQAIQAEVDALDAAGVKIIIVSTHLQGFSTEIAAVAQLRKVDAIISGGGSELFASPGDTLLPGDTANAGGPTLGGTGYPRFIPDADGNPIPAVTTSGLYRYLGQMVLDFDANGNLLGVHDAANATRPIPVLASLTPDATALSTIEQPVAQFISGLATNIAATTSVTLDGRNISTTAGIRAQERNVGNLFADSALWQATVLAQQLGTPVPDVAIQNGGGIRNDVLITPPIGGSTTVSELNTYQMAAFNNFIAVVPNVSPATLKALMENAVSRLPGFPNQSTAGNGRWAHIAGMQVTFDTTRQPMTVNQAGNAIILPGDRVRSIVLSDGRVIVANGMVVPGAPSVNVATIDFLVSSAPANAGGLGGDNYPWGTTATFTRLGVTYQRALSNYIRQWLGGVITQDNYPLAGERRLINIAP
ncbi:MAG: 5'-nucleotidase C-terminal domain-containing protein [Phycisphaerales bacterium]|jgi:5'-nucleotidase|nr:5'-nucleotidase C-terminal domain-containing protein [Phycisphaerales bacterium]